MVVNRPNMAHRTPKTSGLHYHTWPLLGLILQQKGGMMQIEAKCTTKVSDGLLCLFSGTSCVKRPHTAPNAHSCHLIKTLFHLIQSEDLAKSEDSKKADGLFLKWLGLENSWLNKKCLESFAEWKNGV